MNRPGRRLRAAALWLGALAPAVACSRTGGAPHTITIPSLDSPAGEGSDLSRVTGSCTYDVRVVEGVAVLDVVARCAGFRVSGFAGRPELAGFVGQARDGGGRALSQVGGRFTLPPGMDTRITYRVDLDRAGRDADDFDVALSVGRSLVAPVSSFILAPEPAPPRVTVEVRVTAPDGFVTAAKSTKTGFVLRANEIAHATYAAFGRAGLDHIELPGPPRGPGPSMLTVASLDGRFAVPRAVRATWEATAARAVAEFYGGFPVERALLVVAPIPGRDRVLFGKLLPAGGSGVVVLVGADAGAEALRSDWILFHELFHVGFPSFAREAAWLDEGLATYFEPILRARAGLLDEAGAWAEITRDLERGVRLAETTGLEHPTDDPRAVYWGGAAVALVVDVEARRRSPRGAGLEGGVRAVLQSGGDATRVWPLERAIAVIDASLGAPILATLARAHAKRGSPLDLGGVLAELGVERLGSGGGSGAGSVRLHDEAPLAPIRRAIVRAQAQAPR